jgi:hypothetical protein
MSKAVSVFALMLGFAACGPANRGDDGMGGDDGTGTDGGNQPRQCNKMDIVFVVDDSGSMAEEQDNLASNFPMFATLLSNYTTSDGLKIDYRVALTTTGRDITYNAPGPFGGTMTFHETGPDGEFFNNCGLAKRWLEPTDTNMQQTLACRADVGTDGSGMEMPLLMTKWALEKRVADTNAGFLRDDALLAVVMLTDEDDSSTTQDNFTITFTNPNPPIDYNPADHVQFLDTLKGNRSRWAAAAIAGDGDCSSAFGEAANAARIKDFVNMANSQGTTQAVFSSICAGDLTIGLKQALDLFQAACGDIIL